MPIQSIFCNPPICVARVGGSSVPMESFTWVPSVDPHNIGETRIEPTWTLDVQPDASISPRLPDKLTLRDQGLIRPVAPFIEIWCELGDDNDPDNWERRLLTNELLNIEGLNTANLSFEINAMNFKVARRTDNPNHRFGTFPSVTIRGNEHTNALLRGVSPAPTPGDIRMIPNGRSIPLGQIQVIRPTAQPQPGDTPWENEVNIDAIRLRFTPPKGEFYGPANSDTPSNSRGGTIYEGFPEQNAFLDLNAGWFGADTLRGLVVPGDTYDGAENDGNSSEGVIDDTSELRIAVSLDQSSIGRTVLQGKGTIFCGPPDYAPDRRPFLTLADSFNDRARDKEIRNQSISDQDLDRWVEDLFERTFETVSLFNVDFWRNRRASSLSGAELGNAIEEDTYPEADRAMGGRDALRNPHIALNAPSDNIPLPMSERARERHRNLSDIVSLKRFIRENPNRLEALVRPPFSVAENENRNETTMQMPPFMRQSNARPLTLAEWQYDLIMEWQRRVLAGPVIIEEEDIKKAKISKKAEDHRARVLQHINEFGGL